MQRGDMEGKELELKELEKNSPADIAAQILKFGGNLDGLEKLMELQERHEKNEARKAYHAAMAEFKKNPPEIIKNIKVRYQNNDGSWTGYNHADLGEASIAIGEALAQHDLNATWKTEQENGDIKVTCTITHKLGHSESTFLKAPPDTSGKKNAIQAIASTASYLERYTLFAITGTAPKGIDDDSKSSGQAEPQRDTLTPKSPNWKFAKQAYLRNGNLDVIKEKSEISEETAAELVFQCAKEIYQKDGDFKAMDGFEGMSNDMQLKIIQEASK